MGPIEKDRSRFTIHGLVPEQAGEIKAILILVWVPRTSKEGIERYDVLGYALQSSLQALGNAFGMLHFDSVKRRWHRTTLIGDAAQSDEDRAWRDLEILSVQIRWGSEPKADAKCPRSTLTRLTSMGCSPA